MACKTIARNVGAAEALGVGEVTIAEDTTLAVILIEFILKTTRQASRNYIALVVLNLFRDEAIGILLTVRIIVVLIIIAIEVGTIRKTDFLHILLGDGDMFSILVISHQNQGIASEAGIGSFRQLEHRGVVCQDGCTLGEGISSAINSFIDIDMYVVPIYR